MNIGRVLTIIFIMLMSASIFGENFPQRDSSITGTQAGLSFNLSNEIKYLNQIENIALFNFISQEKHLNQTELNEFLQLLNRDVLTFKTMPTLIDQNLKIQ